MSTHGLTRRTEEHYEALLPRIGDQYIRYRWDSGPVQRSHYRQTRASIRRLFEEIGSVEKCIEVGCGPGTWTDICREHARQLLLIDLSVQMIDAAKRRFTGDADIEFLQGDYLALDLSDQLLVDVIFSARALEYMDHKERFVRKSSNHILEGGVLAVITKNPRWRDKQLEGRTAGHGGVKEESEGIQTDWIGWNELERLFRANGFTDVRTYPVALGSYHQPFRNRLGAAVCSVLHRFCYTRPMRESWDPLTESYLTVGTKARSSR